MLVWDGDLLVVRRLESIHYLVFVYYLFINSSYVVRRAYVPRT